jgi:hypothetical protein
MVRSRDGVLDLSARTQTHTAHGGQVWLGAGSSLGPAKLAVGCLRPPLEGSGGTGSDLYSRMRFAFWQSAASDAL